jgi:hypothetical protein
VVFKQRGGAEMKKQFFMVVLVLMSFLVVNECRVLGSESERKSLKGLKGVYVPIENFGENKEEGGGLTTSQLQTDVELRLRKAGIRILTKEEWLATKGGPYLYVSVFPVMTPDVYFYASIEVQLKQNVLLERDPSNKVFGCSSWSRKTAGYGGKANFVKGVRDSVGDLVDKFINDYLAVNPIAPITY